MIYKEYEGCSKAYVIVHVTGTGVMEDQFIHHDVVFETDDKEEAELKSIELKLKNNSASDLESTWYNNRYEININTISDIGKQLHEDFKNSFNKKFENGMNEGIYTEVNIGGLTFYIDGRI